MSSEVSVHGTRYNPRTMARAIKFMGEVSSPGQVKNVSEVGAALTKWISKVKMLESPFGEKAGDEMKIAMMTSMPRPWTSGRLGGMTTTRARSKWMPLGHGRGAIGAMVRALRTGLPVQRQGKSDFGKGSGKGNHKGNCNFKGGYRGDGKNNQYKDDGKGGKGQKGGGKGYQGTCWRCGTRVHKADPGG